MYTLKIRFQTGGKVYYFASSKCFKAGDKAKVAVAKRLWGSEQEEVIVVGCLKGISPRATKWKSGGPVTTKQYSDYPFNPLGDEMNRITAEDIMGALQVFEVMHKSERLSHFILQTDNGSASGDLLLSFKGSGEFASCNKERSEAIIAKLYTDPRKTALETSLKELLEKAQEIKTQIERL